MLPRRRHDAEKSSFATKLRSRQQRSPLLQEDALPTIDLVYICFSLSTKIEKVTKNMAWL